MALLIIIVAGVGLRVLGIFRPLLGNFAIYQTAQAMMARFFVNDHFTTLFYPQVNDLVAGKPGLLLLYYPVSSLIAGIFFFFFGGSLDFWGRLQAIVFFGAACLYLFRLVKILIDEKIALASVVVFSLSPLTVIYGQSFQNEMATVFFTLVFLYDLLRYFETRKFLPFIFSFLSLSLLLLTRPNGLYLLAPAFYLAFRSKNSARSRFRDVLGLLGVTAAGLILPALWYFHLWRVSQQVNHIYSTLFAQLAVRSSFASPLVLSGSYYRDLLDTMTGITLTPVGFTLLVLGLYLGLLSFETYGFFIFWALSFFGSSLLMPRKLIEHEFYLLPLVTAVSPLIGKGFYGITGIMQATKINLKRFAVYFLAVSFLVSMRYAEHPAFKTPEEDHRLIPMAQKLQELTSKSQSRIVVQGTHSLLYFADRYGWPFLVDRTGEISDYYKYTNFQKLSREQRKKRNEALKDPVANLEYLCQEEGATHFVVTDVKEFYRHPDFAYYVHSNFKLLFEEKNVGLIFDLKASLKTV